MSSDPGRVASAVQTKATERCQGPLKGYGLSSRSVDDRCVRQLRRDLPISLALAYPVSGRNVGTPRPGTRSADLRGRVEDQVDLVGLPAGVSALDHTARSTAVADREPKEAQRLHEGRFPRSYRSIDHNIHGATLSRGSRDVKAVERLSLDSNGATHELSTL